jgi:hypothetical protein
MPSKNDIVRAAIVSFAALVSVPAQAVLISFDPVTSTVVEGDTFDVGIRVSGLEDGQDEIVSGFDLDVFFDSSILLITAFTSGAELGPFPLELIDLNPKGLADLLVLSILKDDELAAAQGDSVLLGRLSFTAIGVGKSLLDFGTDPVFGQNVVGRGGASLPVTTRTGLVTVVSVPEPETLALLFPAVLLFLLAQRRRRSQPHAIRQP